MMTCQITHKNIHIIDPCLLGNKIRLVNRQCISLAFVFSFYLLIIVDECQHEYMPCSLLVLFFCVVHWLVTKFTRLCLFFVLNRFIYRRKPCLTIPWCDQDGFALTHVIFIVNEKRNAKEANIAYGTYDLFIPMFFMSHLWRIDLEWTMLSLLENKSFSVVDRSKSNKSYWIVDLEIKTNIDNIHIEVISQR
jgi:hypothetical protein